MSFKPNYCILSVPSIRPNLQPKEDSTDTDAYAKYTQINYLKSTWRENPFSEIGSHKTVKSGKILKASPF